MANETGLDSTGVSTSLPAWLRTKALKARYGASKIWKHAYNAVEGDPLVLGNIKRAGNTVTLQIFPSLTPSAISTTDGSMTDTEVSPTAKSVTIDKWYNVSMNLVDIVDFQSILQWETEFSEGAGKAMSQQMDDSVLALVQTLTTNTVGDGVGGMTDPLILAAQTKLDNLEVPKDERFWGISPRAHSDLLGTDKFTLANVTGFTKGVQVEGGRVVGLYGTPVEVTSRITTSTAGIADNVLAHREAFGVVMQRDFKLEKFARTQYATKYGGSCLYGVVVIRDNHAVWVKSAA